MSHTPEPWFTCETVLGGKPSLHADDTAGGDCWTICRMVDPLCGEGATDIHVANARRIVACVNACAGINPEAVPKLLAALKLFMEDANCSDYGETDGEHPMPLTHLANNGPCPACAGRAALKAATGGQAQ